MQRAKETHSLDCQVDRCKNIELSCIHTVHGIRTRTHIMDYEGAIHQSQSLNAIVVDLGTLRGATMFRFTVCDFSWLFSLPPLVPMRRKNDRVPSLDFQASRQKFIRSLPRHPVIANAPCHNAMLHLQLHMSTLKGGRD
jgi:hypothetical protein